MSPLFLWILSLHYVTLQNDILFRLWPFASLKSQMLGSEMVPQVVPLRSPYAFVVFGLSSHRNRMDSLPAVENDSFEDDWSRMTHSATNH